MKDSDSRVTRIPLDPYAVDPIAYVSIFFFSSRRRHTRWPRDWSSDVCSSDLAENLAEVVAHDRGRGAPEQLARVTVGRLNPAVGSDEEHAVRGRLEDLRQLQALGLRLGVEARVLERDGRLVAERLEQHDLVRGEIARRAVAQREHADRSPADGHQYAQHRAVAGGPQPDALIGRHDEPRLGQHIARPGRAALG